MSYDFQPLEKAVQEAIAIPASYTDFTDVDPNVLHEIAELEIFLKTKGNGRAFREAVIQLFKRYILTVSSQGNANLEVSAARGTFKTLKDRLDNLDMTDESLAHDIAVISNQITSLIANAGDGSIPSELIDIRTGGDGVNYATAGEAVRKQLDKKVSYKPGVNVINSSNATIGFYVSSTAGAKNTSSTFQYNTVQSLDGITYYLNIKAGIHIAFFNSSNTFISGLLDPTSFVTPAGTRYFTVSYPTAQSGAIMVSKTQNATYQPYVEGVDGSEVLDGSVTDTKLSATLKKAIDNAVPKSTGLNVINKVSATTGYYVSATAGSKNVNTAYQYNSLTVVPNENYYTNFATGVHYAFFDSATKFISGVVDPKPYVIVPSDAVSMTVSYQIAQKDAIVVSKIPVDKYIPYQTGIDGAGINAGTITKTALNSEILSLFGADKKTILVGPGQQYTSLLKAIAENQTTVNTYQLVNAQIDMKQEYIDYYGADFFTNYVDYSGSDYNKRGYNLKYGDSLISDPKSKIVWDYDASNANVNTWFSPLNLTINNHVKGVRIEVTTDYSCRYIVHDDFAYQKDGFNHVEGCHFKGRSYFFQIVGGGMMLNSEYLYEDCIFEDSGNAVDPSNTKERIAITFHNNSQAGAKNKVTVKNCWTSPELNIRATWLGQSTEMSEFIVHGCKTKSVYVKAHASDGSAPNENVKLFEWNNPLWTV